MSTASPSIALAQFTPFDRLEPDAKQFLDAHARREHFAEGHVLVAPELGEPTHLFIVAAGKVRSTEASGGDGSEVGIMLSVGECFPIGAVSGRRVSANLYVAATPLDCYLLSADDFHRLMAISSAFTRFCSSYLSTLVSQSRRQLQAHFAQQAIEQQSLNAELRALTKRRPVVVRTDTSIRQAVEIMSEQRIGSLVVVDAADRPVGVFTQSDVVRRVVVKECPLDHPVAEVMTTEPVTLPDDARAYDAMFAMASNGIRHVLVVDGAQKLAGVISERDLFALQRIGLSQVRRAIATADSVPALRNALRDVRQFAFKMLAQGVEAEQLTRFISTLNDSVTGRILELRLAEHDLDDIEWAWLAFGSEGREEQTLYTDQDNGIVFLVPDAAGRENLRGRLLAFAKEVNAELDRCGFPLCKGGIMAGNPEWCLSLDEWKARFSQWISSPQPQALLNSTIFFDFRCLYGRRDLVDRMSEHLLQESGANSAFQRMLAGNALTVTPPLGVFRDFVTETAEDGEHFIDLKKSGSRLFVDVARVFALAHGIDSASTVKRLRRTAQLQGGAEDVEAVVDAFNFIQLLRLRHQHFESGQGRPGDNRIVPDQLNQLDRRILKEALRQARKLQQRLKLNYQL